MMKTKRIHYVFLFLLVAVGMMTSCVKDDDFDTPDTNINPPEIDGDTIAISGVKMMFAQEAGVSDLNNLSGDEQFAFQETDLYMVGYVVSSDESGNFYQEMVLQDKPENPTSGIKIMIQANPLFTKYEIGRKIYVELDGFTIGFSNGVIALGVPNSGSDFVNKAPEAFQDKLIRTPQKDSIVPLEMSISDFSRKNENLFIRLNDVEFPADIALGDNAKTFAADPGDQFDAERQLESCTSNSTTKLLTSTFADFKALSLPRKSGHLDAVLAKTFNGSQFVVKLNSPADIHFEEDRCDGEEPGEPSHPGEGVVVGLPFSEDYESLAEYDPINNLEGWTNQDITGSSRLWEARQFDGNTYAQLTAYNAQGQVKTWMVTPGIDLDGASSPKLSFDTKDGHYNGDALTVYISTDFDGDAGSATWTEITDADLSQGHENYADNFTNSGDIDLSSYAGEIVHIGFKYEGSNDGVSTTYQVDNVSVSENGGGGGDDGDNPEPPSDNATLAFAGGNFEDWNAFINGLNSFGIKDYATESNGTGIDGSTSLHIVTDPTTTGGNDYVFTALATSDLPSSYTKISFYMKGTASKSVSLNVYSDSDYHRFNLEDLSDDAIIQEAGNNQYTGTIDTGGEWVLVTLDLSGISDLNTTDTSEDFFALKIGKNANYDLQFDNFTIE